MSATGLPGTSQECARHRRGRPVDSAQPPPGCQDARTDVGAADTAGRGRDTSCPPPPIACSAPLPQPVSKVDGVPAMATGTAMTTPRHETPALDRRSLRKLMAAGLIGSSIEWYDFFIYATAAALVFGELFFPNASPLIGTLLAFSTFWAGFIARPIGGLVFGHFGDKVGRKPALVTCLILMGSATFVKIGRASCRE